MNYARLRKAWKRFVWIRILRKLNPIQEVTTIHNKRVRVNLRDEFIGPALYLNGEIDTHMLEVMRFMNLKGSICLDIGANLGLFSLAMSDLVGDSGKVFAFEPESHNFELLQHNLRRNLASNVVPIQTAIGDYVGECELQLAETNFGDHQIANRNQNGNASRVQASRMTTVDTLLRDLPDGSIRLIKIDVQGYECHVFRGMTETLKRNPEAIILVEVGPGRLRKAGTSVNELMKLFSESSLTGWEFHDYRISPIAESWVYELFPGVREEDFIISRSTRALSNALKGYYGPSFRESTIGEF